MEAQVYGEKCIVCQSGDIQPFLQVKDYSISGEEFSLCKCSTCGFIWTINPPGKEEIGPYYASDDYVSHSDTSSGLTYRLYHTVRNYMLRQKARMVERELKIKGKLLDYGCGTGYFLNAMHTAGWQVRGMEPDEGARRIAHDKFGLEVRSPDLKSVETASLDAVTLWHVLEHVHDLKTVTEEIERVLKPGGLLIVAVPNSASWDAKHYKQYWAAWDVPRHLWHFSRENMEKLLLHSGFKLTGLRTLPFDIFYVSMLSEKYKGSGLALPKAFLKGCWGTLNSLLRKEQNSSLVCLLRKKDR